MKQRRTEKAAYKRSAEVLLIGFLLLYPALSRASLDPAKPLHQFTLQNWQAEQGLPQNSVLSLAQTGDGYLWAGTEEGLARYDGVRIVTFDSSNSRLSGNIVRTLFVDRQQTLWIGTQSGLLTYRNNQFTPVSLPGARGELSISSILEDHAGTIWVGTDSSGLFRIMREGVKSLGRQTGLLDDRILSLAEGKDGTLWIVTGRGLNRLRAGQITHVGTADGLLSDDIRAVYIDHADNAWIGTGVGLNRLSAGQISTFTTHNGLIGNEVTALFEDAAHSLWIGTRKGVTRFSQGKFSSFGSDSVASETDINTIFEDRQGDLWLGTGSRGLICLKEGAFTTLTSADGLTSDMILAVLEDRAGNLWVGSDHGLTRRAPNGGSRQFTSRNGLSDDLVLSLAEDQEGAILVGTRLGVSMITKDRVVPFLKESAAKAFALAILPDHLGNIWIGDRGGLSRYSGQSTQAYTSADGLPDNFVTALQEDRSGTLWVGTTRGLASFSDDKFRTYDVSSGLPSNRILAIYCDGDNIVWLATAKGLSRLRAGRITSFRKANRRLDVSLNTVLEDRSGNLWLSSNRGILKLSKRELNRYADGVPNQGIHISSFTTTDGLRRNECNGGFQPAGWVGKNGKLYFPTVAGVAVTDPAQPAPPPTKGLVIERLLVDDTEYSARSAVVVPPGSGKIEIQFSSPDLHFQNRVQFRYMLENFDHEWVNSQTRRTAYYTNIPHGEYRFLVQSSIDGRWGAQAISQPLQLKPHFYETQGFYVFLVIAILTVGGATYRVRMDQIASRELRLRELVNERTFALRESEAQLRQSRDELEQRVIERTGELLHVNNSLEEEVQTRRQTEELLILAKEAAEAANRAKSDFLANMSHELRTPINGIVGMTEIALTTDLDSEQTEYLELAKVSADSLLAIVNDILDFSKIEARKMNLEQAPFQLRKTVDDAFRSLQLRASQKGLSFQLTIWPDVPEDVIGDWLRVRQVLLNLIDNAVKFTSEGGVSVSAFSQHRDEQKVMIHFTVKDTGIGIPPEKTKTIFEAFSQADTSSTRRYGGTGLGLTISHELAVMQGGDLWVESTVGVGSVFHFTAYFDLPAPAAHRQPSSQYDASITV